MAVAALRTLIKWGAQDNKCAKCAKWVSCFCVVSVVSLLSGLATT